MSIADMLRARQRELAASKAAIERDLDDVAVALAALGQGPEDSGAAMPQNSQNAMSVDDAIVRAVEAGQKTPRDILAHLSAKLGVHTTINSVRTRVSKLKNVGRIAHDGMGWVPALPPLI